MTQATINGLAECDALALKCTPPMLRTANLAAARLPPKTAFPWYLTPEHREWSKAVIERAGRRCHACGRDNTRLFADHIVEIRDGGDRLALSNGQALCGACHSKKTSNSRSKRLATQTQ